MAKEDTKRVTRGMPNNIEAEASLLGSILIDGKTADIILPTLKAEDFYLSQNRIIFEAMKQLQADSKPIDTVTVADALELQGKLDEVGSISYLSELAEGVVSAASGEYYASIVKRDSMIRRVIEAGNEITKFGYEAQTGNDALENAEKLVYAIAEETSEKQLLKVDDAAALALKMIQDEQSGNVPKNTVYTDFPSFDRMTHGLKPGEMVLIAARPSVGKTAFALNIATNVAINHGKKVAIFSLEMPADLLARRMLTYLSGVPSIKMQTRGGLTSTDYKKLYASFKALIATDIYIDDYSLNGPSDVLSKCRRLKREKGLDLVIIDYLQLMTAQKSGRASESRQVEVSDMSRKMKIYAKELGCPIVLLSQMSRAIESRDNHTPMLSDLRESGSIEQDADIVAFLNNPSRYNPALPENEVILDVKKNRNGAIGEIKLDWDGATTTFREMVDPNANTTEYVYADKPAEDNNAIADVKAISQVAEDLQEVASDSADMPFEGENMPFDSSEQESNIPSDIPAPTDDDVPFDTDDLDDDEYVDEYDDMDSVDGDGDDSLPF